jgi:hypothetical protein
MDIAFAILLKSSDPTKDSSYVELQNSFIVSDMKNLTMI